MKISEIIIDENIYPRKNFDPETVSRYCEALSADATLPPLVVMPDGRLLDGRHRYEAYKQAGVEEAEVITENPDDPDARAVELNLRHDCLLTEEGLHQFANKNSKAEIKKEIEVVEPKGELLKKLLDILRIKCLTMLNR